VSGWKKGGLAGLAVLLAVAVAAIGYVLAGGRGGPSGNVLSPLRPGSVTEPSRTPIPVKRVAKPRTSPADFQAGVAILLYTHDSAPPDTFARLLDQLAVASHRRNFAALDHALEAGTSLPAPSGVFPRYIEAAAVGTR